jgi:hypothetical protein
MGQTTNAVEWAKSSEDTFTGPYGESYEHLIWQHPNGAELHTVSHQDDGDEWAVTEGGTLLYDLWEDDNLKSLGSGIGAVFCPKSLWERNHYVMMDVEHEHQAAVLMAAFDLPQVVADDELEEGQFAMPSSVKTMADAHAYLQKLGYEYTDMTSTRHAAPAVTAKKSAGETTAAEIIQVAIEQFEGEGALRPVESGEPIPAELYLGQTLADALDSYEYPEGLEQVVISVLEKVGLPDPLHSVYAWAERDDILERLKKAQDRGAANMPAVKALPAIQDAKKWAETDPADLTGKQMDEVYRLAIRGKIPQIAAIGWCFDEERKGGANPDEIGWYCGYIGHDGRLIRDLYIPDHVFTGWFPEMPKVTWNDYEPKDASNYHTMPEPDEPYIEGTKALLASRYTERGAVQIPDMVEPPVVPVTVTNTMTPTRAVGSIAAYHTSGGSRIETLTAYPPGHTGKATPVAAAPAAPATPAPAPASVNTGTGTDRLWREYQLDLNALKSQGIERAGYQVVETTPKVVFALGFLDDKGGIVDPIPQQEIVKLFSEYRVECLDAGFTYSVSKLFGQSLSELESVVRDRLQGVNIFDAAS